MLPRVFAFALLLGSAAANNKDAVPLFSSRMPAPSKASPYHVPGHVDQIRLNRGSLNAATILVDLFEDGSAPLTLRQDRTVIGKRGEHTWMGQVVGFPNSVASFSFHKGAISGSIVYGVSEIFEISSEQGGTAIFAQIDEDKLPPTKELFPPASRRLLRGATDGDTISEQTSLDTSDSHRREQVTSGNTVQDIMVVYTPASRTRYGGIAGIEAKIVEAIQLANQGYINSQINLELNLVYMYEVGYTETGDMGLTLSRLRTPGDGFMDEVHSVRDQYGADLVAMISEDNNYCGIAYVMTSDSSDFAPYAFSVTFSSCISGLTFTHEIGHNQGSTHNIENGGSAAYPYSYGYRVCNDGSLPPPYFRTIMAYGCTGATRQNLFSSPNLTYEGAVAGTETANNAESIRNTMAITAAFRASVTVPAPNAPSNLEATTVGANEILISWQDNSSNEETFRLERYIGQGPWEEIESLASDVTSFSDITAPWTTNSYRVRAVNGGGSSEYSNVGQATLTAPTMGSVTAAALSGSEIRLNWGEIDGADSYVVERLSGGSWQVSETTFTDTDLQLATEYSYNVTAQKGLSSTSPSPTVSATTSDNVEVFPSTETNSFGTVTGSLARLDAADGNAESIREEESSGNPSRRISRLSHEWYFTLPNGWDHATVTATAWHQGEEAFNFDVSLDGGNSFSRLFVVNSNSASTYTKLISGSGVSDVRVRVLDANRVQGERTLDTVYVDQLFIKAFVSTGGGSPPSAPSNLVAVAPESTEVQLTWNDNSIDELGFEVERSEDGGTTWVPSATTVTASSVDFDVLPSATYDYRVRAYNTAGNSAWSNVAQVVVPAPPTGGPITLNITTRKEKGFNVCDLTFSGATTSNVEIYRNSALVTTTQNDGFYMDNTGQKGGASYVYTVCDAGGSTCSPDVTVVF